jgi:hypothetical protein
VSIAERRRYNPTLLTATQRRTSSRLTFLPLLYTQHQQYTHGLYSTFTGWIPESIDLHRYVSGLALLSCSLLSKISDRNSGVKRRGGPLNKLSMQVSAGVGCKCDSSLTRDTGQCLLSLGSGTNGVTLPDGRLLASKHAFAIVGKLPHATSQFLAL